MARNLQHGGRLRPVDLTRGHGLSTQAIRNYEQAGILPAAGRTPHGYRTYTSLHARALRAFLALVPGHGHQTATSIMRAVNEGAAEEAFRLMDESHAQLLDDRRTLQAVERALRDLEPTAASEPTTVSEPGGTFIGPLAGKLGLRPATLRKWERAGLVRPRRDPRTGYRVYDEADVRDARLAHQLRRGGYLLAERGINLSSSQVYRLVTETPERLSLKVLMALLDILDCSLEELIEPVAASGAARPRKAAGGGTREAGVGAHRPKPARITR